MLGGATLAGAAVTEVSSGGVAVLNGAALIGVDTAGGLVGLSGADAAAAFKRSSTVIREAGLRSSSAGEHNHTLRS